MPAPNLCASSCGQIDRHWWRALSTAWLNKNKKGTEMKLNIEQIARVAHETNQSYCHSIGDHSQTSWDEAPKWQKQSALNGVQFHLDHHAKGITPAPSASHDSWLAEKEAAGWKYGPVKDPTAKEHPCFVPYEMLPPEQRIKDYLFGAVVSAFWEGVK
jgi:predicted CxxxxCH...CXXCH cytochrome family protein